MQLKALNVFCDVVACRSFSRAANGNSISQSGASQMVHQLEEYLGVKLIDRSKRPFVLTREGEVFYKGCLKIVQRFNALEDEVRTLHENVAGKVEVASIYSVGFSHMNLCLQQFLSQNPQANVRLQYQHPAKVLELVESDQIDLGLVSYSRSTRTVKAIEWRQEPMVLVCAPGHPLAGRESVSLTDLGGYTLVGFDRDLRIRREIDRALTSHGVEVDIALEFDNTETIKRAVEIDAGISLLPLPTVQQEAERGTLVPVRLKEEMIRPLGIIHRRGKELGKTAQRFIKLLLAEAKAQPAAAHNGRSEGCSASAITAPAEPTDDSKRRATA